MGGVELLLENTASSLASTAICRTPCSPQLPGMSAAPLIREGHVVPLLTQHITDHMSVYVCYGSRTAQPTRVRAFIDLAVERLSGGGAFILTAKELASAESAGRKASRRRR